MSQILFKLYQPEFAGTRLDTGCIISFNKKLLDLLAKEMNEDSKRRMAKVSEARGHYCDPVYTAVVAVEPEPEPDLPSLKF